MVKTLLFLSNGHGEDLNGSLILQAIVKNYPEVNLGAMPLVGAGNAYKRLNIPIIGPTQTLPSGGIFYMNPFNLLKDLWGGLIGLTLRQLKAVRKYSRSCDLLVAVGDIVPITIAYLTGRPYVAFIVSTSSYYEGRLRLPWITEYCLRSSRCLQVFTRDEFTAQDLRRRKLNKAIFAGYPIMDVLTPTGRDLELDSISPMMALLPGSRLPEAQQNFALMLQVCEAIAWSYPLEFRAALVPSFTENHLEAVAKAQKWRYLGNGKLVKSRGDCTLKVQCYWDRFPDILESCKIVLGMAGTAVEQAVGLGKPVVQIAGKGPQFTYRFAEAQMRLLGDSVRTIGKTEANSKIINQAAQEIIAILEDETYLQSCVMNGKERVGEVGGSETIAHRILSL
jgi:uncharacterized protein (TIGR03492 family)